MLPERILDIREENKLKQVEMAKLFNINQKSYSRWETGETFMPLKHLNTFCNYFNVNMDYMVGITRCSNGNGNHVLDAKVIGNRLKEFRKKNRITQTELAKLLNTTHSTISAYEAGKTTLLTSFAIQIVEKYNISLDWLCGRI